MKKLIIGLAFLLCLSLSADTLTLHIVNWAHNEGHDDGPLEPGIYSGVDGEVAGAPLGTNVAFIYYESGGHDSLSFRTNDVEFGPRFTWSTNSGNMTLYLLIDEDGEFHMYTNGFPENPGAPNPEYWPDLN